MNIWHGSHLAARAGLRLRRYGLHVVVGALLVILLAWPAVMLIVGAFRVSPPGQLSQWTIASWHDTLSDPTTLRAIASSCLLAAFTTVVGLVCAAAFAFFAVQTDVPFRRLITPAMLLMFATPSLFYAMGYSFFANQYTGTINSILAFVLGPGVIKVNVESWAGLLIVTTFRAVAFMYLFLIGAFRSLSASLDEASLISGFSRFQTFLRIDIPVLAPALTGTAILGVMAGLQTFDTALIIGEPAGIKVISTQVYDYLVHSAPPKYSNANVLSTILIVIVGTLCLMQLRLLGRRSFVTIGGKAQAIRPVWLGRWRWPAGAFIIIYLLIAEAFPLGSLFVASVEPFPGVFRNLSFAHYASTLARDGAIEAIWTTLSLMALVGGSAMGLAVVIAYLSQRLHQRSVTLLRFTLMLPYAMAGIVVALAVTSAYVSVPGLRMLYGTIWLMIVAMIVVVIPFASQTAQAAVSQVAKDVQEAARVSGASSARMVVQVLLPLIAPSFISGWYVTAVIIGGNLDVPLILGAPGLTTVSARVFALNSDAKIGDAAALLIMLMAGMAAIGALGVLCSAARHRYWRSRRARFSSEPLPKLV